MPPRIMYIEDKSAGLSGPGRIGRVRFSQTGRSVYYGGRTFQRAGGSGFKSNYFEVESGAEFGIWGCKRRGGDRLYPGGIVEIDEDVREEYWVTIRGVVLKQAYRPTPLPAGHADTGAQPRPSTPRVVPANIVVHRRVSTTRPSPTGTSVPRHQGVVVQHCVRVRHCATPAKSGSC